MHHRRHRPPYARELLAAGVFACVLPAGPATAMPEPVPKYPTRALRVIVATPSGTATDFFARVLGEELAVVYQQRIIVNNRSGAGGLIGNTLLSQAPPDGYTLGMVSITRLVTEIIRDVPPYRALDDAAAVMQVASIGNVLAVPPAVQARKVSELIAYARGRPGELNYASLGIGHSSHISAALFSRAVGMDAVHVPFRALNEAFIEMLLGRVHYCLFTLPSAMPMLREGKLRPLAITSAVRNGALPDVPTMLEAGVPEGQFDNWSGVIVPAGTPRRLIEQLHGDLVRALRRPGVRDLFARHGAEPTPDSTPGEF
ncbi:MAG: Bug family tripartite tricarboxylate transporter substrate binding protein, partial [Burkholderiales bacterium]